jgi:hypothetical protein
MSIVSLTVATKPNTTKVGTTYLTAFNTIAANSGQLRLFPNKDEVAVIKAIDVHTDKSGELELRKYALANMQSYEPIKYIRWTADGDRVISIIDEEFEAKGDSETFDVYIFVNTSTLFELNMTAEIMKRAVWDAMKLKERQDKGIDERIG